MTEKAPGGKAVEPRESPPAPPPSPPGNQPGPPLNPLTGRPLSSPNGGRGTR